MHSDAVFAPISAISGVGQKYQDLLANLNITTIEDLLWHIPVRYQDRSNTPIEQLITDEKYTISGTLSDFQSRRFKAHRSMQQANLSDDTGTIKLTWFNQPFLKNVLKDGTSITVTGKTKQFGSQLQFSVYEYAIASASDNIHTGSNTPIYSLTRGISQKWLRRIIRKAINYLPNQDWLPDYIIKEHQLIERKRAFEYIHFPTTGEEYQKAHDRLSFEELYLLQLRAQYDKQNWHNHKNNFKLEISTKMMTQFSKHLPFNLTNAQSQVINTIYADLSKPIPMNRLVQGDVGSGKTAIAAAAMYAVIQNNYKCVLLAPTQILANQHYKSLQQLLKPLDITISLQTSNSKEQVDNASVIVGTHALLHRELPQDIALIVIDEQHRFGVNQRNQLLKKPIIPNTLSLTATPIPRTIALTLYADLDVSIVDELPQGRIPIKTWQVPQKKRTDAYNWINSQIDQHQAQVFIVCPLIEPSEALKDVKNVTTEYETIKSTFPDKKVKMVHGKTPATKKTKIIKQFSQHKFDILVATPVIEVGIDIKDATIMVIEDAHRFGLAALHQLRGRVGRSDKQSYCLLFSSGSESKRLSHLTKTNSGLKLAEHDLETRGAGEIYGIKQSGHLNLKIASLYQSSLIKDTNLAAQSTIEKQPKLDSSSPVAKHIQYSLEKNTLAN